MSSRYLYLNWAAKTDLWLGLRRVWRREVSFQGQDSGIVKSRSRSDSLPRENRPASLKDPLSDLQLNSVFLTDLDLTPDLRSRARLNWILDTDHFRNFWCRRTVTYLSPVFVLKKGVLQTSPSTHPLLIEIDHETGTTRCISLWIHLAPISGS